MDKTVMAIAGVSVLIFVGIIIGASKAPSNTKAWATCVQHSNSLAMHIHPELEIDIDGQKQAIPANIGIDPVCMKAIHTHDESGTLHIEHPQRMDFILANFFDNWGKTFTKDQILDKKVDATHVITMTVDGQPSEEYENLTLRDGQKIVIRYEEKK